MGFDSALDELADRDASREDVEMLREEFDDTVDVDLLRDLVYALQSVSIGSQQLMYFAGSKYAQRVDLGAETVEEVFEQTGSLFEELGVGRLEVEASDGEESRLLLHESAFTYGGPEAGKPACFFVAGFIAGALKRVTGEKYVVNEVACGAQGEDQCVFVARRA